MNTVFSTWLKNKIAEKGISISKLCEETNIKRTSIYNYMQDVNRPKLDSLKKLCDVLGADMEEAKALYIPKQPGRPFGSGHKYGAIELPTLPELIQV